MLAPALRVCGTPEGTGGESRRGRGSRLCAKADAAEAEAAELRPEAERLQSAAAQSSRHARATQKPQKSEQAGEGDRRLASHSLLRLTTHHLPPRTPGTETKPQRQRSTRQTWRMMTGCGGALQNSPLLCRQAKGQGNDLLACYTAAVNYHGQPCVSRRAIGGVPSGGCNGIGGADALATPPGYRPRRAGALPDTRCLSRVRCGSRSRHVPCPNEGE